MLFIIYLLFAAAGIVAVVVGSQKNKPGAQKAGYLVMLLGAVILSLGFVGLDNGGSAERTVWVNGMRMASDSVDLVYAVAVGIFAFAIAGLIALIIDTLVAKSREGKAGFDAQRAAGKSLAEIYKSWTPKGGGKALCILCLFIGVPFLIGTIIGMATSSGGANAVAVSLVMLAASLCVVGWGVAVLVRWIASSREAKARKRAFRF